jgi:hypothetical protein
VSRRRNEQASKRHVSVSSTIEDCGTAASHRQNLTVQRHRQVFSVLLEHRWSVENSLIDYVASSPRPATDRRLDVVFLLRGGATSAACPSRQLPAGGVVLAAGLRQVPERIDGRTVNDELRPQDDAMGSGCSDFSHSG